MKHTLENNGNGTRYVEILNQFGIWEKQPFLELKELDVFKLFEADGTPVTEDWLIAESGVYISKNDNDVVWAVKYSLVDNGND